MFRALVIAAGAATLLGACTVTTVSSDPYYSGYSGTYYNGGAAYNPPGWLDRDRNGVDDRVQRDRSSNYYYSSGYQGGYYDRWGNWHSYR